MAQPTRQSAAVAVSPASAIKVLLLIAIGVAALFISAKIKVPFWPVPITLQTMIVMLIGAAYGLRLGVATVISYLALGAMGMAVFTNTPPLAPGPAYFLSPTGGFLLGFVICAAVIGYAVERGWAKSLMGLAAVMFFGDALLFLVGLAWLGQAVPALGYSWKLLEAGLFPFILGDLVKIALAASLIYAGRDAISRLIGTRGLI
ncbi:MAG: biotin transporter BioY [Pseudomonadota bacterium]